MGDHRVRPRFMVALGLQTPGLGSTFVRGGIDPGDHRFHPRVVGVVDVWEDF